MNLELLFQSADLTGNNTLRTIAISHANTTIKNHIRPDGGTWHVIHYDAFTGAVTAKKTAQGFSDNRYCSVRIVALIHPFSVHGRVAKPGLYMVFRIVSAQQILVNISWSIWSVQADRRSFILQHRRSRGKLSPRQHSCWWNCTLVRDLLLQMSILLMSLLHKGL